jgi:hypothetical protein
MILGQVLADIEVWAKWLGIASGVLAMVKIIYELNNIYNHLLTTDKIVEARINRLDEKITKVDEDVKEFQFENREARARIMDRLLELERRTFATWDKYVKEGLISKEQLTEIRNQEKGQS